MAGVSGLSCVLVNCQNILFSLLAKIPGLVLAGFSQLGVLSTCVFSSLRVVPWKESSISYTKYENLADPILTMFGKHAGVKPQEF